MCSSRLWQPFGSRAMEAREPCQVREEAAVSDSFHVPRTTREVVINGFCRRRRSGNAAFFIDEVNDGLHGVISKMAASNFF